MIRKLLLAALLVTGMCVSAYADETSSRDGIERSYGAIDSRDAVILVIETSTSFIPAALDALGESYDWIGTRDFSSVDLSGYDQVFVCIDGGLIQEPSIANVAEWCAAGGCLHIFGGSQYQPLAQAMNDHLLANNTNNYFWDTSTSPHSTVTDATHYLAAGLPATHDFADQRASQYMLRPTDTATQVAAINGDGYDQLLSKDIGLGTFNYCNNTTKDTYWEDPADLDWGEQVVANMLTCEALVATENSSWGSIKSQYR